MPNNDGRITPEEARAKYKRSPAADEFINSAYQRIESISDQDRETTLNADKNRISDGDFKSIVEHFHERDWTVEVGPHGPEMFLLTLRW